MPRLRQDLALADTACPICGEACKLLLPITGGNYAFSCIVHHDFEVTAPEDMRWFWSFYGVGKPPRGLGRGRGVRPPSRRGKAAEAAAAAQFESQ
jgi:hypothetical protein